MPWTQLWHLPWKCHDPWHLPWKHPEFHGFFHGSPSQPPWKSAEVPRSLPRTSTKKSNNVHPCYYTNHTAVCCLYVLLLLNRKEKTRRMSYASKRVFLRVGVRSVWASRHTYISYMRVLRPQPTSQQQHDSSSHLPHDSAAAFSVLLAPGLLARRRRWYILDGRCN